MILKDTFPPPPPPPAAAMGSPGRRTEGFCSVGLPAAPTRSRERERERERAADSRALRCDAFLSGNEFAEYTSTTCVAKVDLPSSFRFLQIYIIFDSPKLNFFLICIPDIN
jgi:hypothetical protein